MGGNNSRQKPLLSVCAPSGRLTEYQERLRDSMKQSCEDIQGRLLNEENVKFHFPLSSLFSWSTFSRKPFEEERGEGRNGHFAKLKRLSLPDDDVILCKFAQIFTASCKT